MRCTVRRILPTEGEILREVRLRALAESPQAFSSTFAHEGAQADTFWESRAQSQASGCDACTYLAFVDRSSVGLVSAFRTADITSVELVSLWVAPQHRRGKIASKLIDAIISWARDCDFRTVELWITSGNNAAKRFYNQNKFRITGDYQPIPDNPHIEGLRMTYKVTLE